MIDLYVANTGNGQRAAIILEECGLPYTVHKLNLAAGDQHKPEFLRINPAGAIPAIMDRDGPGGRPVAVSQSGAIVLYAAEKSGKFLPSDLEQRAEVLRWFMHACTDCAVTSGAIFALGNFAPEKSPANVEFFENRLVRFLRVIDGVLGDRNSIAADVSIADFALYPVYVARKAVVERAGNFANLTRWATAIGARPAVQRGLAACG